MPYRKERKEGTGIRIAMQNRSNRRKGKKKKRNK
jgi:hypothetical protein